MQVEAIDAPVPRTHSRAAAPPWLWVLLRAVGLGAVYAGIYELITVETSFGTSVGSTLWPASGVTVAVLLLRPRREWPVYIAAIAVADFTMDIVSAGFPARIAVGLAVANCLEPLLSATLLRRWILGRLDLSRLRDLGLFYFAAGVCGPMLSATVGSIWNSLMGGGAVWPFGPRWYVGDALGAIVVAPLILTFAGTSFRPTPTLARRGAFALTLAAIAVALPWRFSASAGLPFLVIPALSVTGILLGTRAAAVAVFAAGAVVETLTTIGHGPFSGSGAFTGSLSAQMYLVACSASGLTAAALMAGLASREEMALHDSLTGLANRRLLMDRISVACSHLARRPGAVGLVFVDLDGFKAINDQQATPSATKCSWRPPAACSPSFVPTTRSRASAATSSWSSSTASTNRTRCHASRSGSSTRSPSRSQRMAPPSGWARAWATRSPSGTTRVTKRCSCAQTTRCTRRSAPELSRALARAR